MTFREKLADWISGGKLTSLEAQKKSNNKYLIDHLNEANKGLIDSMAKTRVENDWLVMYLDSIRRYTSAQKSGTAQKVTRMCNDALDR